MIDPIVGYLLMFRIYINASMNNTSDPTENKDTNNNRIHPCEVMLKIFSIS